LRLVVGERYVDQLELTGHAARPTDLDLPADLRPRTVSP
jgi:hypothetical protein